ncbi:rhamnogalacturonan lyase [Myxococcota bacterium]
MRGATVQGNQASNPIFATGGLVESGGVTGSAGRGATAGGFASGGRLSAIGGSSAAGSLPTGGKTVGGVNAGGAAASGGAPSVDKASSGGSSQATAGGRAVGGGKAPGGASAEGAIPEGGQASGGASFVSSTATGGAATPAAVTGGVDAGGGGSVPASKCGVNSGLATGKLQMEDLCRGLVAVHSGNNNFLSWRLMGYEPFDTGFNVYRDGSKVNDAPITDSTNYVDSGAAASATYTVRAIIDGQEQGDSSETRTGEAPTPTWTQDYLAISLEAPANSYTAGDAIPGDLDGDGQYELVLKWDPADQQDNANPGVTSNVYLDGLELDGTRLWRIDLGRNIRAGAHYTQPVVYDLDGDGKSEVVVKTAPGTQDATGKNLSLGPAANDDDSADYRGAKGTILTGPEYLTVFSGDKGTELATVNFEVARGRVDDWGDNYGNRSDRFLSSAAIVSDTGTGQDTSGRPVALMGRGYYERATVTAWAWRDGELTRVWTADSDQGTAHAGQGAHSMAVANVDDDLGHEIIFGSSTIDSNGTRKCSTGFGHGDALHVGDLVPSRAGLEVFMPHEDAAQPSWDVHDANTCTVIAKGDVTGKDTGRGAADDITPKNSGGEVWVNNAGLFSAADKSDVGSQPGSCNFLIWWDGDESRELLDGNEVTQYDGEGSGFTATGCSSINGTKSTPNLSADLLGDWREEVVFLCGGSLRIYTTTQPTTRRIYTLMHDPQYRMQVSSEQTAYNQPPHPSFHIGDGMKDPPRPDIHVK